MRWAALTEKQMGQVCTRALRPVFLGLLLSLVFSSGCGRNPPEHQLVHAQGDYIKIPVKEVNDGKVHFYTWKYEGKNINFFVRTDGKGQLRTHYDACYSCYKYKMGFKVVDDEILCIACGYTYALDKEEWDFIGPCSPIPLKSIVTDEFVEIRLKRIKRGKKLF